MISGDILSNLHLQLQNITGLGITLLLLIPQKQITTNSKFSTELIFTPNKLKCVKLDYPI
ncbi:hypothetical protein QE417_003786 [Mucilaginibacter terrae]|uniref:Uncharacterized protein n=1 Tax=Mucilaginibacter terrae TaxID=1955052 RepID=A0ABU3GY68_9SPHI|nr:hypothetical protein [Mucilaginibacter terrae]